VSTMVTKLTVGASLLAFLALLAMLNLDTSEKLRMRAMLFESDVQDVGIFDSAPSELSRYGFIPELDEARSEFVKENSKYIFEKKLLVENVSDPIKKAKSIVLLFADPPTLMGPVVSQCGVKSESLRENLAWVLSGRGCCSDHSQVFIAIASINGLFAREVHNSNHTFNEFWHPGLGRWVWIDSQFGALAVDEGGKLLSLVDISYRFKTKRKVNFIYFNKSRLAKVGSVIQRDNLYSPEAFSKIGMTVGNGVFRDDRWNERLWFLPKSVKQFILIIGRAAPRYISYSESRT
jgi:hypothetical protein